MNDVTNVYNEGNESNENMAIEDFDVKTISEEENPQENLEDIKSELFDIVEEVINSDLKSMIALDVLLVSGIIGTVLGFFLGLIVPLYSDVISHYLDCIIFMIFAVTPFVALFKQKPVIVIKIMKILKPMWHIYGISLLICMALPFGLLLVIFFACVTFPFIGIISVAIIFGTSVSIWINSLISLIFLFLTKCFPIPEKTANKIILVVDIITLIVFITIPLISMLQTF